MRKNKFYDFAYLKGKARDRKGVGMELALLVLLVVFACSTLLVSSAMIGKSNLKHQEQQLRERLALDQLAETVLAGETPDGAEFVDYAVFKNEGGTWNCTFNTVNGTLNAEGLDNDADWVVTDSQGNPLLIVALDGGKITRWSYH